jgi:hypothetical protein
MKAASFIGDKKAQGEYAAQIEALTGTKNWTK